MNNVTITPTDNGPYVIQGGVTLLDGEGNPYQLSDTIALCRCGHSSTKPFCDGSHEQNGKGLTPALRGTVTAVTSRMARV